MNKACLLPLMAIPIATFAAQPTNEVNSLIDNDKAHVISDARSGGGEDRFYEVLSIQVIDSNGPTIQAKCTLSNDKGNWSTPAPDTVTVARSASDLTIVCSKAGYQIHTLVVSAGTVQIQPKHFRFQGDSDESDDLVTVPYYNANITVNFTVAVAPEPPK